MFNHQMHSIPMYSSADNQAHKIHINSCYKLLKMKIQSHYTKNYYQIISRLVESESKEDRK